MTHFTQTHRPGAPSRPAFALLSAMLALAACAVPTQERSDSSAGSGAELAVATGALTKGAALPKKQAKAPALSKNPFANSKWHASRDRQGSRAVQVRFRDGLSMRLQKGQPRDVAGKGLRDQRTLATFEKLALGTWQRSLLFPADKLDDIRKRVEKSTRHSAPDLNLYFTYSVPKGMAPSETVAMLEMLPDVQFVYALPQYEVAAVEDYRFERPGDLAYQAYLEPVEAGGMDVFAAWDVAGGDGEGIDFMDIEFGFEPGHMELDGTVTDFGGLDAASAFPSVDPRYIDHGTASMGVAVGDARGPGITGIAPAAGKHFVPVLAGAGFALPSLVQDYCAQIDNALSGCGNLETALVYPLVSEALSKGDVILLELQMSGPNAGGAITPQDQFGAVAVEYNPVVYDAIRLLTLAGIVVVEAAGNGEQRLDDAVYQVSAHQPFAMKNGVRVNDSGAIVVGAVSSGMPWSNVAYLPGPGSPLAPTGLPRDFTNHGDRVDVHAWGDGVVTAGYGYLYGADEPVLAYTHRFSGTSSASALVAGAATALQGAYHSDYLAHSDNDFFTGHLYSTTMRALLQRTGVDATRFEDLPGDVQNSVGLSSFFNLGTMVNVGQRPNLREAVRQVQIDAPAYGEPLPRPALSAPSGSLERDGQYATVGIRFDGEVPLASHRGVVDIVYTTDGSEPDCLPRCGGCNTSRVRAVTQVSDWRLGSTIQLDMSAGPVTVRARTALFDCGAPYGPEEVATYE